MIGHEISLRRVVSQIPRALIMTAAISSRDISREPGVWRSLRNIGGQRSFRICASRMRLGPRVQVIEQLFAAVAAEPTGVSEKILEVRHVGFLSRLQYSKKVMHFRKREFGVN